MFQPCALLAVLSIHPNPLKIPVVPHVFGLLPDLPFKEEIKPVELVCAVVPISFLSPEEAVSEDENHKKPQKS